MHKQRLVGAFYSFRDGRRQGREAVLWAGMAVAIAFDRTEVGGVASSVAKKSSKRAADEDVYVAFAVVDCHHG